ncbi:hypothetical protein [Rickettsiella massiliensis]|nr:hypothetical protein [Rickettsiella massiliensis]
MPPISPVQVPGNVALNYQVVVTTSYDQKDSYGLIEAEIQPPLSI